MIGICGDGAGSLSTVDSEEPDKRKAVETLLADAEWAQMSDREAAKVCGVSHSFVAAIRSPEVREKQRQNVEKHFSEKKAAAPSATQVEFNSTPPPPALPIAASRVAFQVRPMAATVNR